ncbi:hypothetical protein NX722_07050 [Endozoicomonas gorgoniicola]|uniref:DUF4435 domain-containing protein n=1 Tax=Endozoicomonas gorgoniicola TaxID=1234144 RepID=A0ABT3MSQ9_9GAMM|nr:hypothetical protein [Endozoicomonas gorgoniicola]MCW7552407.1 hypothetical protein [Endozoicomonas gorgoniicola]
MQGISNTYNPALLPQKQEVGKNNPFETINVEPHIHGAGSGDTVTETPINLRVSERLHDDREKRINQCVTALKEAFPLPEVKSQDEVLPRLEETHYWYSNDYNLIPDDCVPDYNLMLQAMKEKPEAVSENPRVALLVGESSLLSSLPELSQRCDIVLLTDYDHLLLHSQLERLKFIMNCKSVSDEDSFFEELHSNIANKLGVKKSELDRDGDYYKTRQGESWAFSSDERLAEMKDAVNKLQFVPVCLNLFCKESLKKLGAVLQESGAQVKTVNLTNIFDYYRDYVMRQDDLDIGHSKPSQLLGELAVHPEALVHSSRILIGNPESKIETPEKHWNFLDKRFCYEVHRKLRLDEDSSLSERLMGALQPSIYRSSRIFDYYPSLKMLIATCDLSDFDDLVANQEKIFFCIEECCSDETIKVQMKEYLKMAIDRRLNGTQK